MKLRRAALTLILLLAVLGAFLSARREVRPSSTSEAVARLQAEGRPFVIYFYSETCNQCREMEAILKEVRPEFSGAVTFLKVDVYNQADRAVVLSNRVRAVPSLAFYAANEKPHLLVGVVPAGRLRERLQALIDPAN